MSENSAEKGIFSIRKKLTLKFIALLMSGLFFNSAVFAAKPEIILFYADWHAKTREAQSVCSKLAGELGVKLKQFNIDRIQEQKEMDKEGLAIPSAVPYVYILDNRGDVVYKKPYNKTSAREIEDKIQKYL